MTDQNKVSGKIINYNSSYIGDVYFSEKISDLKIKDSDDYNNIIIPGFIDLHCHGGNGFDVMEGSQSIIEMSKYHLRHGTTSIMPTTWTNTLSKLNKRLFEITDIFIDNKIPPGDAIINIKDNMVGPASTITGSFILNSILIEVANILKNEKLFPFYISVNMPNAKKNNDKLEKKFSKINPHL